MSLKEVTSAFIVTALYAALYSQQLISNSASNNNDEDVTIYEWNSPDWFHQVIKQMVDDDMESLK